MTHYEMLGVPTNATYEEIKKAWKMRVLECHPDKYTDEHLKKSAHDKFIKLSEAYKVLIDESSRRRYDLLLTEIRDVSIPNLKYTGYQNANREHDLSEIEIIRKNVFAESQGEFVKNTFGNVIGIWFSAIMAIGGLASGNIFLLLVGIFFLFLTVLGIMEMSSRVERMNKRNNK